MTFTTIQLNSCMWNFVYCFKLQYPMNGYVRQVSFHCQLYNVTTKLCNIVLNKNSQLYLSRVDQCPPTFIFYLRGTMLTLRITVVKSYFQFHVLNWGKRIVFPLHLLHRICCKKMEKNRTL